MSTSRSDLSFTPPNGNNLKKAHRIRGKTAVIIDQSLVDRLGIDEDSWFEESLVDSGILLKHVRTKSSFSGAVQ
jgi:hypothetical protein